MTEFFPTLPCAYSFPLAVVVVATLEYLPNSSVCTPHYRIRKKMLGLSKPRSLEQHLQEDSSHLLRVCRRSHGIGKRKGPTNESCCNCLPPWQYGLVQGTCLGCLYLGEIKIVELDSILLSHCRLQATLLLNPWFVRWRM